MRISLYLISVFLFVLVVWGSMDILQTPTTQGNAVPIVSSVIPSASSGGNESMLTLAEGTTTTLYVRGSISDTDGCMDVAASGTVTGKFYRSNVVNGANCSADNNDCYTIPNTSCTKTNCTGGPDTTLDYECTASIQYYADTTTTGPNTPTDWTAKITATDAATASGSATGTIEMNSTMALDVSASINYGSMNLGDESPQQTLNVTNTGNIGIDLDLSGSGAMSCTSGTVPVDAVHYSGTTGFAYSAGTPLSVTPTLFELDLANRTNDATPQTKNVYTKLKMPSGGVGGNCSNTLTANARADTDHGW